VLPDLEACRIEAVRRSGKMLRDNASTFWGGAGWKLIVTDDARMIMFTLHFLAVSSPATQIYNSKPSNEPSETRPTRANA